VTTRTTLLLCAMPLALVGCTPREPPHVIRPIPQAMQSMLNSLNQIRAFSYGGGDQRTAESAAVDLVSWSHRLSDLFPPGQASTEYVDMNPDRVHGASAVMSVSAERLLAAVRTGNRPFVGGRIFDIEQQGCGFCHRPRS